VNKKNGFQQKKEEKRTRTKVKVVKTKKKKKLGWYICLWRISLGYLLIGLIICASSGCA
jgi:hypothetical protein